MSTNRVLAPFEADERTTLTGFLDFQRATLAVKCEGLTGDQLRQQAVRGFRHSGYVSLRWVITHLIEEYARHNGHADLLRERLDGSTGE